MAVGAITQRELPVTQVLIGRSKLTGGTVDVTIKQITDNSLVFVSGNDSTVTGILTIVVTAATKFSITSSVGGDAGYVAWMVIIIP